ncbi:hypothetical protein IL306_008514 [Fusarium sp. DS 682]|nr:hypothetical protein IL306_008514 [Fusarium sp. DS 682]
MELDDLTEHVTGAIGPTIGFAFGLEGLEVTGLLLACLVDVVEFFVETGFVVFLVASTLYQFFNGSIQDAIAPIMQNIIIDSATVTYDYTEDGKGDALYMNATFALGAIELDLTYINKPNDKDGPTWSFKAQAEYNSNDSSANKQNTLGEMLIDLI